MDLVGALDDSSVGLGAVGALDDSSVGLGAVFARVRRVIGAVQVGVWPPLFLEAGMEPRRVLGGMSGGGAFL